MCRMKPAAWSGACPVLWRGVDSQTEFFRSIRWERKSFAPPSCRRPPELSPEKLTPVFLINSL